MIKLKNYFQKIYDVDLPSESISIIKESQFDNYILSIIMRIYNSDYKSIYKSIEKFINLDNPILEMVIVDDGSVDIKYINKINQQNFSNISILVHNYNMGRSSGMNTGIKYSKGKYIRFLDPDDELEYKNCIEHIYFCEENDYDFSSGNMVKYPNSADLKNSVDLVANDILSKKGTFISGAQPIWERRKLPIIPYNFLRAEDNFLVKYGYIYYNNIQNYEKIVYRHFVDDTNFFSGKQIDFKIVLKLSNYMHNYIFKYLNLLYKFDENPISILFVLDEYNENILNFIDSVQQLYIKNNIEYYLEYDNSDNSDNSIEYDYIIRINSDFNYNDCLDFQYLNKFKYINTENFDDCIFIYIDKKNINQLYYILHQFSKKFIFVYCIDYEIELDYSNIIICNKQNINYYMNFCKDIYVYSEDFDIELYKLFAFIDNINIINEKIYKKLDIFISNNINTKNNILKYYIYCQYDILYIFMEYLNSILKNDPKSQIDFQENALTDPYWTHRWDYIKYVYDYINAIDHENILEVGPYNYPIIKNSDTLDIRCFKQINTYLMDLNILGNLQDIDRKYDIILMLNMFEHLERKQEIFQYFLSISKYIILSFMYNRDNIDKMHNGINLDKIYSFTSSKPLKYTIIDNKYIVLLYKGKLNEY